MKLTAENYYGPEANQEYFSVSQFKDFERCPACAMAKIRDGWRQAPSTAMLVGSYVDAHFEGTLGLFRAQHPEILNSRTGELKADFQQANQIIQRAESDAFFMGFMRGEKQSVFTGEIEGVPFKVKTDVYLQGERIVDLKCMRSMERVMGRSFIEHWSYDLQLAAYQEIISQNTGKRLPVYLAVLTKEDDTDLAIVSIPQSRLDECLGYLRRTLPGYAAIKAGEPALRCEACSYCKQTKKLSGVIDYDDVGYTQQEILRMKGAY